MEYYHHGATIYTEVLSCMRATIHSNCLVFVINNLHIVIATMTQCDMKYFESKISIQNTPKGTHWPPKYVLGEANKSLCNTHYLWFTACYRSRGRQLGSFGTMQKTVD